MTSCETGASAADRRPVLAITMGDPAGIGPEVVLAALAREDVRARCRPVVYGGAGFLVRAAGALGMPAPALVPFAGRSARPPAHGLEWVQTDGDFPEQVPFGQVRAEGGRAALAALEAAVKAALAGEVDAVVTAPVHKEALRAAGCPHPGHTELLAALTGAPRTAMMLAGRRLRVVHVTTHMALSEAIRRLSVSRVIETIELADAGLRRLGWSRPRLAVAGLNPHAGEGGLFGREELDVIGPAVEVARHRGIEVSGPWPPDTVFWRAWRAEFDAVVCMYHDQGHIPVKLLEFRTAVNVTLGLPIIRTSVDHGTALDLAGRGIADPTNMCHAILVAARLATPVSK